jgi:hypothetical protein
MPDLEADRQQHLAAIKQLFAYRTSGGILEVNLAASVRGPKYVITRGAARRRCCRPPRPASRSIQLKEIL